MLKKKIRIQVCRSCGRDNTKSDAQFCTEEGIRSFYEPFLTQGPFSRWASLEIVDCLTNCDTPNSVKVWREDRSFDFAWISTKDLAQEVIRFARNLFQKAIFPPPVPLQDHLLDKSTGRGKTVLRNHPLQPEKTKPIWL